MGPSLTERFLRVSPSSIPPDIPPDTSPDSRPHRVLLVEDDPRTRDRLASVVRRQPELTLVADVETFAEGRDAIAQHAPEVLLTDLGLPDGDGTELIRIALARDPDTLCMVVTVFGDERHVLAAIEAGALGYLLKDARPDDLATSILDMLAGGSPISAAIARHLLHRLHPKEAPPVAAPAETPARGAGEPQPHLSGREREVLGFVVKGFTYP